MAARNPTAYTNWIDERKLISREPIIFTTMDQVLDDQEYILDQPVLVLSWTGQTFRHATVTAFTDVVRFKVKNKDMCDVSGVSNNEIECDVYAHAFCRDNLCAGEIRVTSANAVANTTSTISVPAGGGGLAAWYQGDTINIKTNNIEDQLTVAMRISTLSVTNELFIQSLVIIARQT